MALTTAYGLSSPPLPSRPSANGVADGRRTVARQLITVEGVDSLLADVLQDVNLVVNHGERIGIVGHNGAGKTTLLNTI